MNNLGLHYSCKDCSQRMLEALAMRDASIKFTNISNGSRNCDIEDGLLGGKCGKPAIFEARIEEFGQ